MSPARLNAKGLGIALLLILSVVGVSGAASVASATAVVSITPSNGASVCSLSGAMSAVVAGSLTWTASSPKDTCTITGDVYVSGSAFLEVGAGVTIAATYNSASGWGISTSPGGVILNHGTLKGAGGGGIYNGGSIINFGEMVGAGPAMDGIETYGLIQNYGTVTATGNNYGIYNDGTFVNRGGVSGSGFVGMHIGGTFDNYGTLTAASPQYSGTAYALDIGGTVNNYASGTMTANSFFDDSNGFHNTGIINNAGLMNGTGGNGLANIYGIVNNDGTILGHGYASYNAGVVNYGTINNAATLIGTIPTGSYGSNGPEPNVNVATINDYCGGTVTPVARNSNQPVVVNCPTVTFGQTGLPSGVSWGVNASWTPASGIYFLPVDYPASGASVSLQFTGSLTYSYDSPVSNSGPLYECTAGCSGASVSISGTTEFSATYSGGYTVGVSVYSPSGDPLTDATVVFDGQTAVTGLGDSADFGVPTAGTYSISVSAPGYPAYTASVDVSSFTTSLSITMGSASSSSESSSGTAYTSAGAAQATVDGVTGASASFTNTGSSSQTVDVWFVWHNSAQQVVSISEQENVVFAPGQTVSFASSYAIPGTYTVGVFVTDGGSNALSAAYTTTVTVS